MDWDWRTCGGDGVDAEVSLLADDLIFVAFPCLLFLTSVRRKHQRQQASSNKEMAMAIPAKIRYKCVFWAFTQMDVMDSDDSEADKIDPSVPMVTAKYNRISDIIVQNNIEICMQLLELLPEAASPIDCSPLFPLSFSLRIKMMIDPVMSEKSGGGSDDAVIIVSIRGSAVTESIEESFFVGYV